MDTSSVGVEQLSLPSPRVNLNQHFQPCFLGVDAGFGQQEDADSCRRANAYE